MVDIFTKLPTTPTQLSKIKNISEGKAAEYGDQVINSFANIWVKMIFLPKKAYYYFFV